MFHDEEKYSIIQLAVDFAIILLVCSAFVSCTTSRTGLFGKQSLRDKYEEKLTSAGLKQTALGEQWFGAGEKSLIHPLTITLPYKETGFFAADKPDAAGYIFAVQKGEKLTITITKKPVQEFNLFTDLWRTAKENSPKLIAFVDTTDKLEYTVDRNDSLLVRLQPELLQNCEYTLTITTGPSLAFPVPSSANPRIESFWGDTRDAGARKHEGIDIFGKFRTPVVAAADGYITAVNENKLGGKAVWLRPEGADYTLYYAHLDSQIARQGEHVAAGDVVGLMGNTGNAKNTPTHLHFGIYTFGGAVNPLPFVNPKVSEPASINASLKNLNEFVRNTKTTTLFSSPDNHSKKITDVSVNNLLFVKAATASYCKVQLPDSTEGFLISDVVTTPETLRNYTPTTSKNLFTKPDSNAPAKTKINTGEKVDVLANFNNFYYVKTADNKGWILK